MDDISNLDSKMPLKILEWQKALQMREQENTKAEESERLFKEENNLIQLDFWANNQRGVPNSILRGSLFAATQGKNARHCKRELLHETESIKVIYTGMRLNQSDLDVWECALHLARVQNLGNRVDLSEYGFLKAMGRRTGKSDHEWLKNTFAKLTACCVEINHNGLTYGGSLVQNFYRDDQTDRCVLIFDPKIARLYEGNRASWIQWDERQKIGKRKPLAQWLHGYIASHAKWYPHKVETIRDYSGSETKEVRFFKKRLIDALKHLGNLNLIEDYRIDEKNLVHIKKIPSKAQQKYLTEKDPSQ